MQRRRSGERACPSCGDCESISFLGEIGSSGGARRGRVSWFPLCRRQAQRRGERGQEKSWQRGTYCLNRDSLGDAGPVGSVLSCCPWPATGHSRTPLPLPLLSGAPPPGSPPPREPPLPGASSTRLPAEPLPRGGSSCFPGPWLAVTPSDNTQCILFYVFFIFFVSHQPVCFQSGGCDGSVTSDVGDRGKWMDRR